ncbi:MAG TPA: hypothetical protein DCS21_04040, partial [Gammaproteobacteria bacterium]|nr:hypothetical protein [Gammaproteobacteria bacterium]
MKKPKSSTLVSSDYVICAALRRVPDVFNINLLFERNRGPQEGVFLLEALRRYPRIIGQYPRRETRYSHIIVR